MSPLPVLLEKVYFSYAKFLARYPGWFLIVPSVFCIVCSVGWYRLEMEDNLFNSFTNAQSEWRVDTEKFYDFFHMGPQSSLKFIMAYPRDRSRRDNLISYDLASGLYDAMKHVQKEISVPYRTTETFPNGTTVQIDQNLTYMKDLRSRRSPYAGVNAYATSLLYHVKNNDTARHIGRLTYPTTSTKFFGELFIPFVYGGVRLKPNSTTDIQSIDSAFFRLLLATPNAEMAAMSDEFEAKVEAYSRLLSERNDPISLQIFSYRSFTKKVRHNTEIFLPFLPPSMALVFIYALIISSNRNLDVSCHVHVTGGLISVVMAVGSGMGFVMWTGVYYNDLTTTTILLALAIGVDDTFVLLSSWKRHRTVSKNHVERLAKMLGEAGSSITFTSLTDVVAFGIGINSQIPALRDFCIFTAITIGLDFVYQITFFPAWMLYAEKYREPLNELLIGCTPPCFRWIYTADQTATQKRRHLFQKIQRIDPITRQSSHWLDNKRKASLKHFTDADGHHEQPISNARNGNGPPTTIRSSSPTVSDSMSTSSSGCSRGDLQHPQFYKHHSRFHWCPLRRFLALTLQVFTVIMMAVAVWGLTQMRGNVALTKLNTDHAVEEKKAYEVVERNYWNEAILLQVLVKSPDFRNESDFTRFHGMVNRLEHLPGGFAMGPQTTKIWTRDFISYMDFLNEDETDESEYYDEGDEEYFEDEEEQEEAEYEDDKEYEDSKTPESGRKKRSLPAGSRRVLNQLKQNRSKRSAQIKNQNNNDNPDNDNPKNDVSEINMAEMEYRVSLSRYLTDVIATQENRYDVQSTYRNFALISQGNRSDPSAFVRNLTVPVQFHFTTGIKGMPNVNDRMKFLDTLSAFKLEYPEYEIAFYGDIFMIYTDLLQYVLSAVKQTMGSVLLSTLVITLLFLPLERPSIVFWVVTSSIIINASVVGFLGLWNCDVDVILLTATLVSIGLSVDYTVHMAYHYARQVHISTHHAVSGVRLTAKEIGEKRVRHCLRAIATPIVQSGISTLLAVVLLLFLHSYMMRVFFKTIILVVVFGLIQSLLVLPLTFFLTDTEHVVRWRSRDENCEEISDPTRKQNCRVRRCLRLLAKCIGVDLDRKTSENDSPPNGTNGD